MTDFPHRAPRKGDLAIPVLGGRRHPFEPGAAGRISEVDKTSVAFGTRGPGLSPGWRCVASQIGKRSSPPYLLPGDRVIVGCVPEDHDALAAAGKRRLIEVRRARAACKAAIKAAEKDYLGVAAAIQERIMDEERDNAA